MERGASQEDERESRPGKTVREETPKDGTGNADSVHGPPAAVPPLPSALRNDPFWVPSRSHASLSEAPLRHSILPGGFVLLQRTTSGHLGYNL
ncbi:hypothetical protein IscW_ISCW008467 [Ixodes scapularis]|uniref:Uncharacterized protein n=1 Tax=Ixodes scapularis TaxID=6945 RepID=B7PVY0_IXOSC|nr:hypothetical protein IscW_ISCW008467 [Ixodes scapularis]|eukprot:XP_002408791.1 hypothetical protein IscW_ISCW008467 [Ixodes scapularis]